MQCEPMYSASEDHGFHHDRCFVSEVLAKPTAEWTCGKADHPLALYIAVCL